MLKLDNEFCLISSIVSPPPPPLAAEGLLIANELNTKSAVAVLFKPVFKNLIALEFIIFKVFAFMLEETPPPDRYLTVKVVLDGAIPYVFVNTKLVGE